MSPIKSIAALAVVLVLVLGTGLTARLIQADKPDPSLPALVAGSADSVRLSPELVAEFGIQTAEAKPRPAGKTRTLQMSGSTALDPAKMARIRRRFTPFEIIAIGSPPGKQEDRRLRTGDAVTTGQLLAVVRSQAVADKKAELFDAALLATLDEAILDRVEKSVPAVTEVFRLNAVRNVQAGRGAVNRAISVLKEWGIPNADVDAVRKEARAAADRPTANSDEARAARLKEWAKVTLTAPQAGIIVETNIAAGEIVTDESINLFTLADTTRLLVLGQVGEDDLPALSALTNAERRWSVKAAGGGASVDGAFDDISVLIDAKQHTAAVSGYIENKGNALRAGLYVTASVAAPFISAEVSVPATAVVEEKGETFIFVQPDPREPNYQQHNVVVVRRSAETVHIRTKLTPEEKRRGSQTIRPGELVVTAGAIELKALLADLQAPE
jgi:cobalt-zinc-cadmium efflux system membrane fusion protein